MCVGDRVSDSSLACEVTVLLRVCVETLDGESTPQLFVPSSLRPFVPSSLAEQPNKARAERVRVRLRIMAGVGLA